MRCACCALRILLKMQATAHAIKDCQKAGDGLMARMEGIVEIDAGEYGEDIGLQERDQQFERG